jgi:hypothetical protein
MLLTKPLYLSSDLHERCEVRQLTCFTGTKVQILTPDELSAAFLRRLYFSLLALLAQKYKY